MDIDEALAAVIAELAGDSTVFETAPSAVDAISTLKPGAFRPVSPQLAARFARLGAWHDATHGDWLSVSEIAALSAGDLNDDRLKAIGANLAAAAAHWEDDAAALLAPERVSYFAASPHTSERIYLIWLDGSDEPELWVYDVNGESRYVDLLAYLEAFLKDEEDE